MASGKKRSSKTAASQAGKPSDVAASLEGSRRSGNHRARAVPFIVAALGCSLAATYLFWAPLFKGGGLIGGDLYPYYFPQKQFLADCLRRAEWPLWNPFVGFGYPVLGESQTAAFYPLNLVLYGTNDVNSAYNISQLLHYVAAFLGTCALARRWGLSGSASLLAALAFVFGWFPARICLEWAIIGGAWFVFLLWALTAFFQTGRSRYLLCLSAGLALDLLAGHFHLAFITLLALLGTGVLLFRLDRESSLRASDVSSTAIPAKWSAIGFACFAIFCGFLLAGVQLLPTWELKSLSQRQQVNDAFAPTYGHLPPQAISQLWQPWSWYDGEQSMDELLNAATWGSVPQITNQAEAQLYVGLLPLLLAVCGLALPILGGKRTLRARWGWFILGAVALFFATGWPIVWMANWPGFGFFRGPGRYSMVTALALALLTGGGWDGVLQRLGPRPLLAGACTVIVLLITTGDLWLASRQYRLGPAELFGHQVFYATLVNDPAIDHLEESPLRKYFEQQNGRARLYAPGQNIPSLLGVSSIPVYLGLGPELYESPEWKVDFPQLTGEEVPATAEKLRAWGVTHLLLEHPLDPQVWPVTDLGAVVDPFLNRALARREPFYFYQLQDSKGRLELKSGRPENRIVKFKASPNRIQIDVELASDDDVILKDLWYPGWQLQGAGEPHRAAPQFRAATIEHAAGLARIYHLEWVYSPHSLRWGALLSIIGLALACGLTYLWHLGNRSATAADSSSRE